MDFDISKYHLYSTSLFASLDRSELKRINTRLLSKEYEPGEFLFREGSYPKGIYLVRKGKIKIFQANADGKQHIISIYKRGDYFGYRPLLAEENQPVSAVAINPVLVHFLPREEFFYQLNRSPAFAKSLLVNLSKEFSVWINKTTLFSQYSVRARTAISLLILLEVFKRSDDDQSMLINLGRDDFAAFVGTAKETLVRMLRHFKDEGILISRGTKIQVLNPDKLKDYISGM